jgi:hypothetical protein
MDVPIKTTIFHGLAIKKAPFQAFQLRPGRFETAKEVSQSTLMMTVSPRELASLALATWKNIGHVTAKKGWIRTRDN